ncbi:MAG: hypothetical protein IJC64_04130 [Clostridia bacterium]|nr:hypothetical protein [Clostridia bacterium]
MQKRALVLMLAVLLLLRGGALAAGARSAGEDCRLYFDCKSGERRVELVLNLSSEKGICGLWASLNYDPDAVILTFCGIEDESAAPLALTYRDKEGRVDFLLDGDKNCAPECALVRFYFSVKESAPQSFGFDLVLMDEKSLLSLDDTGQIRAAAPDLVACSVSVSRDTTPPDNSGNALIGIYSHRVGEDMEVSLVGKSAAAQLALGFKIFAVDLVSAQTQTVLVVAISGGEAVSLRTRLSECSGAVCVIVTPIIYNGKGVIEGQKSAFVLW